MARESDTAVRINLGHMIVDSQCKPNPMRLSHSKGFKFNELLLADSAIPPLHPLLTTQCSTYGEQSLRLKGCHSQGLARLTEWANMEVLSLAHLGRLEALRPLDRAVSWLFGCRSRLWANSVPWAAPPPDSRPVPDLGIACCGWSWTVLEIELAGRGKGCEG